MIIDITTEPTRKLVSGWVPSIPDKRDEAFAFKLTTPIKTPPVVDLRSELPPCYNQGSLGACGLHMMAGIIQRAQKRQKVSLFMPSRLQMYWDVRNMEKTVDSDAGVQLRDVIKSVATNGFGHEWMWPYDISKFKQKPPDKCYTDATKHKAVSYHSVPQTIRALEEALASGEVVGFGFAVYESFEGQEVADTGIMPMPDFKTEKMLGGHAVLLVGYKRKEKVFIVRNSWGEWGDKGHFYMPYAYIADRNLCSDFWVVRLLS